MDENAKSEESQTNTRAYPAHVEFDLQQGLSPWEFDIVVASYGPGYSGQSEIHQYIMREFGVTNFEGESLIHGKGFKLLAFDRPRDRKTVLLGQIELDLNTDAAEERLRTGFASFLIGIDDVGEQAQKFVGKETLSMWIPLLGAGTVGISNAASARSIADVLTSPFRFPVHRNVISRVTIATPADLSPNEHIEIERYLKEQVPSSPDQNEKAMPFKQWVRTIGSAPRTPTDLSKDDPDPLTSKAVSEMPDQFHSDHALKSADQDDLGRDAIAETIATNVSRVWDDQVKERRPFAIHLSGRWGSGKSSILSFLSAKLSGETTHHKKGWVTIDYNAWRMQDAGPAWWSLLTTVREQGYGVLGARGVWLSFKDWFWRKFVVAWPWIVTLVVLAMMVSAFILLREDSATTITLTTKETIDTGQPATEQVRETVKPEQKPNGLFNSDNALSFVIAIITVIGSLGALVKLIQGWSQSTTETAEAIRGLQSDPTAILKARYESTISNIGRPVVVFIDDLDRCDGEFVVELLQSLQTAYANVAVLYVIASDRDWIVSSYNQAYKGFKPELSKPGEPLGYLFVKKIFQLSVPVPELAVSDRVRLTEALLNTSKQDVQPTATREERAKAIQTAALEGDLSRISKIQSEALSQGQNLADEVMKAVSAPATQQRLKHKLLEYTKLFDGNPRSIKRMINALTFRQGYILSAAEDIAFDKIVRWTILSLRFPYTADVLAAKPNTDIPATADENFPEPQTIGDILEGLGPSDIERVSAFG